MEDISQTENSVQVQETWWEMLNNLELCKYSKTVKYNIKQNNAKNAVPIWHCQWMETLTKGAKRTATCCTSCN